ncbi:hypothetical protein MMC20_005256 [Loxospora ochrophaea]|nr:hypothetical protein [Loxospora ochrophaea]
MEEEEDGDLLDIPEYFSWSPPFSSSLDPFFPSELKFLWQGDMTRHVRYRAVAAEVYRIINPPRPWNVDVDMAMEVMRLLSLNYGGSARAMATKVMDVLTCEDNVQVFHASQYTGSRRGFPMYIEKQESQPRYLHCATCQPLQISDKDIAPVKLNLNNSRPRPTYIWGIKENGLNDIERWPDYAGRPRCKEYSVHARSLAAATSCSNASKGVYLPCLIWQWTTGTLLYKDLPGDVFSKPEFKAFRAGAAISRANLTFATECNLDYADISTIDCISHGEKDSLIGCSLVFAIVSGPFRAILHVGFWQEGESDPEFIFIPYRDYSLESHEDILELRKNVLNIGDWISGERRDRWRRAMRNGRL